MNFISLLNKQFGELTVISEAPRDKRNIILWECKCSCGGSKIVPGSRLRNGDTKTCGAVHHRRGRRTDLVGDKYGRLSVTEYSHSSGEKRVNYYKCICECGVEKLVSHGDLRSGSTKSCGCFAKDNPSRLTHGKSETKVYKAWAKIKNKCYNKNNSDYHKYGAKGIGMSDTFFNNFMAFYAEIGDPPENTYSVDRINYMRGYVEGNIRWATDAQQARNRSLPVTNTSGVCGVSFSFSGVGNQATYVVVRWNPVNIGKQLAKRFNVNKLGLLPAFRDAVIYREKMIYELNMQNAGYAPNHGKDRIEQKD